MLQIRLVLPLAGDSLEHRIFSRKYLRIKPDVPVSGTVRIVRIGCRQTISGSAKVRVIDLSTGGARFASALRFPVDPKVTLQLAIVLEGTAYCLEGFISNRSGSGERGYEYGLCFNRPELSLRKVLIPVFARCVIRDNRHIIVLRPNDGSFSK